MHLHDAEHRFCVVWILSKWSNHTRDFRTCQVGSAVKQGCDRPTHRMASRRIIGCSAGHDQGSNVGIAQTKRSEQMAVVSDAISWIARMIDQYLLSDEEQSARCGKPFSIKGAIVASVLHQVNRRKIASRVVQEHVLGAWVACIDPATIGAGVPLVNGRVILNPRVAAVPSAFGHATQDFLGLVSRRLLVALVANPTCLPSLVLGNRIHELIGHSNGKVRVLEHHGRIGLSVEVRFVAFTNQGMSLLLFLPLALDKLHNIRVPDLQRLHLSSTACLATRLHHSCNLVVHSHERKWPAGLAATR